MSRFAQNRHLVTPARLLVGITLAGAALSTVSSAPHPYAAHVQHEEFRLTPQQARNRILHLAVAYLGPNAASAAPIPSVREIPFRGGTDTFKRHVWQGSVTADGRMLAFVLNDRSGDLLCVLAAGEVPDSAQPISAAASVDTQGQAARLAMRAGRQLDLIPDGSEAALDDISASTGRHDPWRVAWRVRKSSGLKPYWVTITLDRENGRLLSAANIGELSREPPM